MPHLLRKARYMLTLLLIGILWLLNVPLIGNPFIGSALAHDGDHITVQPGDTLSQIAQRYGTDTVTLRRLNNLSNDDYIEVGQQLALASGTGGVGETTAIAQTSYQTGWVNYKVQPGDSLTKLAVRYGADLEELAQSNGLSIYEELYIGQMLRVPADAATFSGQGDGTGTHVVKRGETLGTIAIRYNTTTDAVMQANYLANPSLIVAGQHLALPTDAYVTSVPVNYPTTTEKWIDVDLSQQRVVAYNGTLPVNSFIISSGLPGTPTVTGTFRVWAKTPLQDMYSGNRASGYSYYLKDVPWVQYFHEDYAFHGAYWHNNFGQPMSRGCINMRNEDAQWLYEWASPNAVGDGWHESSTYNPGTLVVVHY